MDDIYKMLGDNILSDMVSGIYSLHNPIKTLGKSYKPPKVFEHCIWALVAVLPRIQDDSDGDAIEVWECRMPARSFRIDVVRNGKAVHSLSTGTVDAELVGTLANAMNTHMIVIDE